MAQDILEKLKTESESLYNVVLHYSAKKWNVIDFKKLSSEMTLWPWVIRKTRVKLWNINVFL